MPLASVYMAEGTYTLLSSLKDVLSYGRCGTLATKAQITRGIAVWGNDEHLDGLENSALV